MKTLEEIAKKIEQLSFYQQLTFGILVSESFVNTYEVFAKKENWGNPIVLKQIIQKLKNASITKNELNGELKVLNTELDTIMPDMDDFSGDIYASLALDVCSMVGECLDFVKDKDIEHIKNVSYVATQSVEFYVADKNNLQPNQADFETIITNSTEMQNESQFQLELVDLLAETVIIKNELFEKYKTQPLKLQFTT